MELWPRCLLLLLLLSGARALELQDLFPFGENTGDQTLPPGSDSNAELPLSRDLLLFSGAFSKVYISANGLVSVEQPPSKEQYLGKTPASFGMVSVLMGDLDRGRVHYRQDQSPEVLNRAAGLIRKAFPQDQDVDPNGAVVVTWDQMEPAGTSVSESQRNTFQLVLVLMKTSSVAILLYPRSGLNFVSTPVGAATQLLEAGFNEGLVNHWLWGTSQGSNFRMTFDFEASVRELSEKSNCGLKGVWLYKIGSTPDFTGISPGTISALPEDDRATPAPVPMLLRRPDPEVSTATHKLAATTASGAQTDVTTPTTVEYDESDTEEPEYVYEEYGGTKTTTMFTTMFTTVSPTTDEKTTESVSAAFPDESGPERSTESPKEIHRHPPSEPRIPDARAGPRYSVPVHPQIVVVDEDEVINVNVFSYDLETCAHHRHKCSLFADCRDYAAGYCCHCRPGFYGNGKDCVAEGKPQRMNGKVSGHVFLGSSQTPLEFDKKDLHSYVVANDGRAYVAISNVPSSLGPSLQPLSSLGGVIGWAFALEQPGFSNGFRIMGGVFQRQAEVQFFPGGERLNIRQHFQGIDEHEHLVVQTELEGHLPLIVLGSTVNISPYTEVYHYHPNLITSSSNRKYSVVSPSGEAQTLSYQWRQTISFQSCVHDQTPKFPQTQQLTVDQIFVMFDVENQLIRYAMSNRIGPVHSGVPEMNPCFSGQHGCDINAVCKAQEGLQFSCECSSGFRGDGRYCHDVDECWDSPGLCGPNSVCSNQPGSYRCHCAEGFVFGSDGRTCVEEDRPVDHCQRGTHDCDVSERAQCRYSGGSSYVCSCHPGFSGDGRRCTDVDECEEERCHRDAVCSNSHGSFSCQCRPGFTGDGFSCSSTEREPTRCEREREHAQSQPGSGFFSLFRPRPAAFVPQCDAQGQFEPTQCHSAEGQCWCVDAEGKEVPGTRTSGTDSPPLCINQAISPTPFGPIPRPGVGPVAPGGLLLFAQSGRIEQVPLNDSGLNQDQARPLLHVPDRVVIAVAYDCVEQNVYWTDITGPSISRAALKGGDIQTLVTKDLQSPEGLTVDPVSRLLFWTDSMRDTVEVSKLDGSHRKVLFDTDLVNPRPIVTDPSYGRLFWADWNRDGPKIEMSNMDGSDRTVLVQDDLGLPNGLTFDTENQQLCWADAGTRRVECMDLHRRLRQTISESIQYPFGLVWSGRTLFYTDWRRESVVGLDRFSQIETALYLPQRRSRLYGISTTTYCPRVYNYCSENGGCSHLCLPRLGGFSCRCPDLDGSCSELNQ